MNVIQTTANAKRLGIEFHDVRELNELALHAAAIQEQEHNDGTDPGFALDDFEKRAKSFGFEVCWPGLYPILIRNGEPIIVDWDDED